MKFIINKQNSSRFALSSFLLQDHKAKQVRDWLKIGYWNHQWTLPSKLADSPMAWMISVDGFLVDARQLPRDIQELAYKKGFIPFLPE